MKNKKYKSKCCNASVKTEGLPDFHGDKYPCTVHYVCTKCKEACNIKEVKGWDKLLDRPAKIILKLKKLFKEAKPIKVINIDKMSLVEINKEINEARKSGKPEPVWKGNKMNKVEKSIKRGIKDIEEGRLIPAETVFKEWEEERKWEKKHPILTKFKRIWWWLRYGIRNKIEEIPLRVRTFIQRGKRGWANSDTWGFDYYLTKVISEGVHHLKENIHGMPCDLTEGQWVDILNKITNTFELAERIGCLLYTSPSPRDQRGSRMPSSA